MSELLKSGVAAPQWLGVIATLGTHKKKSKVSRTTFTYKGGKKAKSMLRSWSLTPVGLSELSLVRSKKWKKEEKKMSQTE